MQYFLKSSGDIFNITLYFNDTIANKPITTATIDIDVNGTIHAPLDLFNYGNGTYEIEIDCSDPDFDGYGWFGIRINASAYMFINQSVTLVVYFSGQTTLVYSGPANYSIYTNLDSFNVTLYFNDTMKDQGISGASINIEVNGSSHTPSSWFDYGNGYYNITIDCSDPAFSTAGSFGITFNVSKQYYYWQIWELIFNVSISFNSTDLIIQNPPNFSSFNSGDIFNLTIYFNDTTANKPISGATIKIDVNGTTHTPQDLFDYGDGTYQIEINCSHPDFNGYGLFVISINSSKVGFINQSEILTIMITGEAVLSFISPSNFSTYDSFDS